MLGKEFHQMFRWFKEGGFQADIPSLRRDYREIVWTSLERWLTREGWANKKSYVRHAKTFDARIPKAAWSRVSPLRSMPPLRSAKIGRDHALVLVQLGGRPLDGDPAALHHASVVRHRPPGLGEHPVHPHRHPRP